MIDTEEYNKLIDYALKEFNNKNYIEAENICNTLTTKSPDCSGGYYLLGHINWEKGNYKQALELFTLALNKATENRQRLRSIIGLLNYMQTSAHGMTIKKILYIIKIMLIFIIKKQGNMKIIPRNWYIGYDISIKMMWKKSNCLRKELINSLTKFRFISV
jgi:tetratricopeptide (TPR) repeat protein